MGRQYSAKGRTGRKQRQLAPALVLSVLVLAGCTQTGDVEAKDEPTTREATGTAALVPSHGGMQGGNLVLVDTGEASTDPITATFGDAAEVQCQFDEKSARHACTVPSSEGPETVDVAFSAGGNRLGETVPYTYTTNGMQSSPVLTVDTEKVRKNAQEVRGIFPPGVQLGATLQNGEPVDVFAQVIDKEANPEYFFVPKLSDAIALREAGIESRIAVLYVSELDDIPALMHYDIEAAAMDPAWAEQAEKIVADANGKLRVHLWIDTGMGREGVTPDQALPLARAVEDAPHLELVGIATHFSTITENDSAAIEGNDDKNITVLQKNRFDAAVTEIRNADLGKNALIHAGTSDVLLNQIEPLYYDLLRVGGAFFGGPSPEERVYSWTTQLKQVKTLPAGWCIDFNCAEPTGAPTKVGLVHHIPARDTELAFSIGGKRVPVLLNHGTVVTLDLSQLPEAAAGDEVVIDFDPDSFYMLDGSLPLPVTISDK